MANALLRMHETGMMSNLHFPPRVRREGLRVKKLACRVLEDLYRQRQMYKDFSCPVYCFVRFAHSFLSKIFFSVWRSSATALGFISGGGVM